MNYQITEKQKLIEQQIEPFSPSSPIKDKKSKYSYKNKDSIESVGLQKKVINNPITWLICGLGVLVILSQSYFLYSLNGYEKKIYK